MANLSCNLHSFEINDTFYVHYTATTRNGYGASTFEPKLPNEQIPEQSQKIIRLQKGPQDHVRAVASEGKNDARHTPNTLAGPDPRLPDDIIKSCANIVGEVNEGTVKPLVITPKLQSALGRLGIDGSVGICFDDTVGSVSEAAPVKPPKITGRPRSKMEYLNPLPLCFADGIARHGALWLAAQEIFLDGIGNGIGDKSNAPAKLLTHHTPPKPSLLPIHALSRAFKFTPLASIAWQI